MISIKCPSEPLRYNAWQFGGINLLVYPLGYNAPAHMHSRRFSVFQFSQGRVATLSKVGLYRRWTSYHHMCRSFLRSPRRSCFRRYIVCLSVCLSNFAQKLPKDLHEIFRECCQWTTEQMITFRWRSRTDSPDGGTDIATLVRRALAEVCTVPVLLVQKSINRSQSVWFYLYNWAP